MCISCMHTFVADKMFSIHAIFLLCLLFPSDVLGALAKPGVCPDPDSFGLDCFWGVYEDMCSIDADCPFDQKCCDANCNMQCVSPDAESGPAHPGTCPDFDIPFYCFLVESTPWCYSDADCPSDQKCCYYDCYMHCITPNCILSDGHSVC